MRSPILLALLHGTRAVGVSLSLRRLTRNGITELSQRASPICGRAAITLGIGPHSSLYCVYVSRIYYIELGLQNCRFCFATVGCLSTALAELLFSEWSRTCRAAETVRPLPASQIRWTVNWGSRWLSAGTVTSRYTAMAFFSKVSPWQLVQNHYFWHQTLLSSLYCVAYRTQHSVPGMNVNLSLCSIPILLILIFLSAYVVLYNHILFFVLTMFSSNPYHSPLHIADLLNGARRYRISLSASSSSLCRNESPVSLFCSFGRFCNSFHLSLIWKSTVQFIWFQHSKNYTLVSCIPCLLCMTLNPCICCTIVLLAWNRHGSLCL